MRLAARKPGGRSRARPSQAIRWSVIAIAASSIGGASGTPVSTTSAVTSVSQRAGISAMLVTG